MKNEFKTCTRCDLQDVIIREPLKRAIFITRFPPQSIFKALLLEKIKKSAEKSVRCTCFHWTECSRETCITLWTAFIFIFPWHMENIWSRAYRRGLPWTTLHCDWWPSHNSVSFFSPSLCSICLRENSLLGFLDLCVFPCWASKRVPFAKKRKKKKEVDVEDIVFCIRSLRRHKHHNCKD